MHFDRAVLDALAAGFFPFPNHDQHRLLDKEMRQVDVDGVDGTGEEGRVAVTFKAPSSVFNEYVLPGINVERSDVSDDDQRKTPPRVGQKYRIPSDTADPVEVEHPETGEIMRGYDEYVQRLNPDPYEISYDVQVRARNEVEAQTLQRYVRRTIRDRSDIVVYDTHGVPSPFTVFRDGAPKPSDEYVDMLNRYSGYVLSYRVEAELDEWGEETVPVVTGPPEIRGGIKGSRDD